MPAIKLLETTRGQFNIRTYGNPDNPPLILIHGWPQSSYCWHHLSPQLSDFFVIAPDIRGMGDSNRNTDIRLYAKDEMARDIFAIADVLEIDDFYLCGHDWGGAIAQEMTFLNPVRIRKLVVINMLIINNAAGKAAANQVHSRQQFRFFWYQFFLDSDQLPEVLLAGKEEHWVRFFNRGISNPVPEDAISEYVRCYKIPETITTTANIYRNMPEDQSRWKQFEGLIINVPTKIIHGVLDPVIVPEYFNGVECCFSEIEVVQLNGGHFILDEQPQEAGRHISEFLQRPV